MGKRGLFTLLNCLADLLTVSVLRVGLQCVSVVFPYHAQLLVGK